MEELYLDFYNSLVAASPEYGKQVSSTQFLKDAVTFNGEDWASLYDALPESNPILQLDKPTFVDAFTPTDEELLFLQNKYAEPVQEGADADARTTPIDNTETSTPPPYEEQIIYNEDGSLRTLDDVIGYAETPEDVGLLQGTANFLKGTYGSGVASGKLGNYVEVEKLLANEGFSFLSDDDYNGIAEQILNQQESQELISDGSGGIWDLTKLLFSSVASSFIGLGTELTRDKDLLKEVGTGAAVGAGISAAGGGVGAVPGALYGLSLSMIHSNADMTAGEIFSSEVTTKLQEENMPITGANIKTLLSDPKFSAELKKDMGVGALIVGAADVVTGKLASTYLRTAKAAKAPILKATAIGLGIEGTGAGIGELGKQKAVNPDKALDYKGGLLEIAGEMLPGTLTNLNAIGKHIDNRKQEKTLEILLDATTDGKLDATIETFDKKTSGGLVTQESAAEVKQMAADVQQMYEALPDDIKADRTKAKEVVRMMMDEARIPTEIAALKAKQANSTGFVQRRIDTQISNLQKQLVETQKSLDTTADANTDAKVTRDTYVRKNAIFNLVKDELGTTPLRSSLSIEGDRFTISDTVKGAEREAMARAANTVGLTELAGVKDLNIGSTKSFRADNIKSSMDIVGKAAEGATTSKDLDTNQTFDKLKELAKSLETTLKTETDPARKSQTAADLRAVLEEASRKYEAEFDAAKSESGVKARAIDGDTVLSKVERAKGVVPEGWNIEVLDDAEYESRASTAGLTKGSRAFTDGKSKTMVINKNNALDTTVEHEVAHVVLNEHFAKDADGSTARTVMQKISDKLARGNENEKQLLAQLNEYMEGSEAMSLTGKAHEFMAELSSWMANNDARLDVNKPVLAKMIQGINDFVEGITGARLLPENFTAREASAYLNKLADSIATGKTFSGNNLAANTKSIKKADVAKTKEFYKDKYKSLSDDDIDEILGITKKGETAADKKQSRAESRRTKEEEKRSKLEQRKQELSDIKKELEELKKEYQNGSTTAARREEIRGRIKALVAQAKYGPTKAEVSAIAKEKGISEAEVPEAIRKGIIDSILDTGYAIKKKVDSVFEAVVQRMKTIMLAGSIAFGAFMGVTQFNQITNANTNPTLVNREIVVQLNDLESTYGDDIVAIAEGYIGQKEIRGNKGFVDKNFQALMEESGFAKGYAWCSIFAESMLRQLPLPTAAIQDIARVMTPRGVGSFNAIKAGKSKVLKYSDTPKVGSIVFYKPSSNPALGHVGIVTSVNSDGTFNTIEGNTSAKGEREGTMVAAKTRGKSIQGLDLLGFAEIDRNSPLLRSKSEGGMVPNNPNPDPNQGSFWFLPFLFGGMFGSRKKKGGADVDTQSTSTIQDGDTLGNVVDTDTDAAPLFDSDDDFLNSLDEALLGLDSDLQAIDTDLAAIDTNLRTITDPDADTSAPDNTVPTDPNNTGTVSAKNLRDLYKINRDQFGLGRLQALASAIVMDRMVGQMAVRANTTKANIYERIQFGKSDMDTLSKKGNALYQAMGDSTITETVNRTLSNYDKYGILYHGTSNSDISSTVLPPNSTGVISERGRKKNLDKVFFTKTEKSANIYAGRAKNEYGGDPRTLAVIPIGNVTVLNDNKGTEVLMADAAIVVDINKDIPTQINEYFNNNPLLKQEGQGAAMLMQDGRAIIYALTNPNVSTPIHEMAHVFEHYLTPTEKTTVMKAAGTPTWTTETSEYFARGFEKYIASGVSPVKSLQKVFDKFKTWLTDIYNGITGSAIDVKLNDDMTALYDSMLADVNPNDTPQSFIDFPESYVPDPRKVRQADLDFVLREIDIEPNNTKDGVSYANQIAAAVADKLINPISLTDQDVSIATALASIYLGGQQGLTFNQVTALRVTTARLGRQLIAMKQSIETAGLQGLDASNDKDRFLEMYEKYDMLRSAVYRHSSETGRSLSQLRALLDVEIDFDAKSADFERAYATLDNKDLKERYKQKINEAKTARDTLRREEAADRNDSGSKLLILAKSTLNTVKGANTKIKSIGDIFKEGKSLFKKDDGPQAQTILNKTNDDLDNLESAHAQFLNDLAMAYAVNNQKAPLAEVVADVQQKLNQFRAQNPNLAIPAFSSEHIIRSMAMANKDIRALQGRKLLGAISDLDSQSSTLPTNRRGKTQGTKQLLEALDTEIANIRTNIGKNTPARDAAIDTLDELINNITNKLVGDRLGAYLGMTKETRAFEILTNARKQLVTKGVMMTDAEAKFVADSLHDLAGEIGLRKGNKIDVSDAERRLVEKYNSTKINNKVVTGTGLKEIASDSHRLAKILYHRKLKELRALEKEADTIAREKNASSFAEIATIKQEKVKKTFMEAWNLQRTLKFSVDLSAMLVQGFNYATRGVGILPFATIDFVAGATGMQFNVMGNEYGKGRITGRFTQSRRAFHQVYLAAYKDMIADFKGDSEGFEFTQSLIDGIMATADGQDAMAMGIEFTLVGDADSVMKEEIYRSDFANKIPVVGKVVKSSGNVYTSHLNVVRYMMYKSFKDTHPNASDFAKREYAKFVMSFTGRSAGFNSGPMAQIFAAPSMYLAQLKTTYYYNTKSTLSLISNAISLASKGEFKDNYEAFIKGLPTELDVASIAILKDYALKAMGLYTIQMLMGAWGWEEDEDRKSRSYGKMKNGDMEIDLGGTSVWTRIPNFAAYQVSREYIGQDFADKIFGAEKATQRSNNLRTVYDDIINAGKYKLMPTFAGTAAIFDGQNVIGEGFGTSYPEHGVRLLSSVFAPIAVDMAVNDLVDVSIEGAKDRVLNKRGTDVAKYLSFVGVNLRRNENNLKHVRVEEALNTIEYVPSATKKDAENYIEGLGTMRDNFIRTGITDAYKADVEDIVGTFILNDLEDGIMPTKEEIQQMKKDIAAEVGQVYADFYASKIFSAQIHE